MGFRIGEGGDLGFGSATAERGGRVVRPFVGSVAPERDTKDRQLADPRMQFPLAQQVAAQRAGRPHHLRRAGENLDHGVRTEFRQLLLLGIHLVEGEWRDARNRRVRHVSFLLREGDRAPPVLHRG